jgi:hypothetical protein
VRIAKKDNLDVPLSFLENSLASVFNKGITAAKPEIRTRPNSYSIVFSCDSDDKEKARPKTSRALFSRERLTGGGTIARLQLSNFS